jgi:hypothetical protein
MLFRIRKGCRFFLRGLVESSYKVPPADSGSQNVTPEAAPKPNPAPLRPRHPTAPLRLPYRFHRKTLRRDHA